MKRLLIIAHTPSPNLTTLAKAAQRAATSAVSRQLVQVDSLTPLDAQPLDLLGADALLFGTCENLATMAGLSKDFFDRCYMPVLEQKQGLPIAAYIRAGHDGTGTTRQLQSIIKGLGWRWVADPLVMRGQWNEDFTGEVAQLSSALAMGLEQGIF